MWLTATLGHLTLVHPISGAEGGLSLLLNVEQYEYMPGPNSGAGLKISLHGQHERAYVRDHGLAIPPGSHAFVALKVVQVSTSGNLMTSCQLSRAIPRPDK